MRTPIVAAAFAVACLLAVPSAHANGKDPGGGSGAGGGTWWVNGQFDAQSHSAGGSGPNNGNGGLQRYGAQNLTGAGVGVAISNSSGPVSGDGQQGTTRSFSVMGLSRTITTGASYGNGWSSGTANAYTQGGFNGGGGWKF